MTFEVRVAATATAMFLLGCVGGNVDDRGAPSMMAPVPGPPSAMAPVTGPPYEMAPVTGPPSVTGPSLTEPPSVTGPPSTEPPSPLATFIQPADGATGVDLYTSFEWTAAFTTEGYYLTVGTSPGARDVYDSGLILPVGPRRRFVPMLSANETYYATIYTEVGSAWLPSPMSFTTGADTGVGFSDDEASILSLVDQVRTMADENGVSVAGTILDDIMKQAGDEVATCGDFAVTLLQELVAARVRSERPLGIAFRDNGYDSHELVEIFAASQGEWIVLDPTFDLVARRASDGLFATAADVHQATLQKSWSAIDYQLLGAAGPAYAKDYYLDYPLLYLDILDDNGGADADVMPYLHLLGTSASAWGSYIVGGAPGATATVEVDGTTLQLLLSQEGSSALSETFQGTEVELLSAGTLYAPRRYVF